MKTCMSPDRRRKNAETVNSFVMLYLQYACDMMTSQVLCPVAINKYCQGAEECFCVQSILELLFF
jgi:hypothetical protein